MENKIIEAQQKSIVELNELLSVSYTTLDSYENTILKLISQKAKLQSEIEKLNEQVEIDLYINIAKIQAQTDLIESQEALLE